MIGQTISHYKITEKLGVGGIGVVYKAEDLPSCVRRLQIKLSSSQHTESARKIPGSRRFSDMPALEEVPC